MKKIKTIPALVFICLLATVSCKKERIPVLTTVEVTAITATTATSGGNITDEGSGMLAEKGICWSKGSSPALTDSRTIELGGEVNFQSNMTGLEPSTTYHVRAYATNKAGTGYGLILSFTTLGQVPAAVASDATEIGTTTATLNGVVNGNYLPTAVTFEYGITSSYGQTSTAIQSPVSGNTDTNVSAALTGLEAGTIYHFRIITVNSLGTTYSEDMTFTTLGLAPAAVTKAACCLSATGARLNGMVNANLLSSTVTFEYGLTTSYGSTVTAIQSPVTGNTETNVYAYASGLSSGTVYHFRIRAENSLGVSYGEDASFKTLYPNCGTVTDIDGNVYHTVIIANQCWMAENLKTTRLNDGTGMTFAADTNTIWRFSPESIYTWYNFDPEFKNKYGALYNLGAAKSEKLCPAGWHVSSNSDWTNMLKVYDPNAISYYRYPSETAGGALKSTGTIEEGTGVWHSPNTGATNESGFTAVPGGYIQGHTFDGLGNYGVWWLSFEIRILSFDTVMVSGSELDVGGYSIRCVKD